MPLTSTLAVVALAGVVASGPVQTYTASSANPSRSEGLISNRPFLPATDPDNGQLLNPAPFPANRTDNLDRPQRGRLWIPRHPVGTRSPLPELPRGLPGPAAFGAPPEALDDVIFIRPNVPRAPVIAISPWVAPDNRVTDLLEDTNPYLGRQLTRLRSPQILRELREAQNQWLAQQGYIRAVRTHVNPLVLQPQEERVEAENIQPRAVIRVHPAEPGAEIDRQRAEAGEPAEQAPTVRISAPASHRPAPIVVVRSAGAQAEAE